jgi:hypothetical protein
MLGTRFGNLGGDSDVTSRICENMSAVGRSLGAFLEGHGRMLHMVFCKCRQSFSLLSNANSKWNE